MMRCTLRRREETEVILDGLSSTIFRPHRQLDPAYCYRHHIFRGLYALDTPELSMGWVDPWAGLGWVELGRDLSLLVGWVGSTIAKVLKF